MPSSAVRQIGSNYFCFQVVRYTVDFNKQSDYGKKKSKQKDKNRDNEDGPVVERKCPKCGHERMSYATLQLRCVSREASVCDFDSWRNFVLFFSISFHNL